MEDIAKYISLLSQEYGVHNPSLVLGLALIAFLLLVVVVIALRTTIQRSQESDRTAAILMRVEKLESNVNEFRAEMQKLLNQFRALTDGVREEVGRVKKEIESGGSGGGSQGGASGGGGGTGSRGGSGSGTSFSSKDVSESVVTSPPETTVVPNTLLAPSRPEVAEGVAERGVEVSTISRGLTKTRTSFLGRLKALFAGKPSLDPASFDDLEEMLISCDVGVQCTNAILDKVRDEASRNAGTSVVGEEELHKLVKAEVRASLVPLAADHKLYLPVGAPMVVLVVGVNGVGKTTTSAKLAARWKSQGKKVVLVAADTFRAAAVQQLEEWGRRLDIRVVSGAENAKPSTVVFDGMAAAKTDGADIVVIDTAGRLHTKSNLMQELEGVRNAVLKHAPNGPDETLLVLDGVSGQNALHQAREFNAAVKLSGVVVTKLDGTPKGGIVIAISRELKLPVAYVGVGEKASDLVPFSVEEFVEGLFDTALEGGLVIPPSAVDAKMTTYAPTVH